MTATREELDKRWPPKNKFSPPQSARGLDATEFVARYGEIAAHVSAPKNDEEQK